MESNWIQTIPDRAWFPYCRWYGPTKEYYDKTWQLPDVELVPANEYPHLIPVTPENFIRAESDRMFRVISTSAGDINLLYHFRNVTPLDVQTVVRMNKDILYSMEVVDRSRICLHK